MSVLKELAVVSGKGGTGKTSVLASFAALAENAVMADCDVDASDLHLVLSPETERREEFKSGRQAAIRGDGCICPAKAIDFPERSCGEWYVSRTRFGPMVHARLEIAAENSGKLVSIVRREARRIAEERGSDWILVDGPPGIGCPVIASVTGSTMVLAVTEPTLSGGHDLERVLSLARHFGIPAAVCVNKWDLNPEMAKGIEEKAREAGARVAGRIRYDRGVTRAQIRGMAAVECMEDGCAPDIRGVWEFVKGQLAEKSERGGNGR
jgi:MinD superfamily P-loop ATPase